MLLATKEEKKKAGGLGAHEKFEQIFDISNFFFHWYRIFALTIPGVHRL
jgi:hypothetical protein